MHLVMHTGSLSSFLIDTFQPCLVCGQEARHRLCQEQVSLKSSSLSKLGKRIKLKCGDFEGGAILRPW